MEKCCIAIVRGKQTKKGNLGFINLKISTL